MALADAPVPGRLHRVLDLSSIKFPRSQLLNLGSFKASEGRDSGGFRWHEKAVQEFLPKPRTRGKRQRREEQVNVDAGAEGEVDR